jgi:predicted dehydrogenase
MPDSSSKLQVAVVGAGAFGRNHARVYRELEQQDEPVRLSAVVDVDMERARAIAAEFGAEAFASVPEMLARQAPQAASVAVPTMLHREIGCLLMEAGVDVLIEKPIASSMEEADGLVRTAKQTGRIAQAAHLERFNPAVRATVPVLTQPMFFEVHRLSMFSPRSLDIDVVLDLMIHDLDVVLAFANSPVKEIRAVGLPILSPKVDIANVRVEFESGCVANFTASRVSTERVRKLRFFQPRQYVSVDYSRQDVVVFTVEAGPGSPRVGMSKPAVTQEEPLRAEIRSFLDAVRRRGTPAVSLEDGRRALAMALDIVAEIQRHSQRAGLAQLAEFPDIKFMNQV